MRLNFNWRALAHHGGAETKFHLPSSWESDRLRAA
jgi:hypothetical protein